MSGYQRFLPRAETPTSAHAAAEVAESAELQPPQGLRAADAVLKPAELRPGTHQPQQASAEVQRQESHGFAALQQVQQIQQAEAAPNFTKARHKTAGLGTTPSHVGADGRAAGPGIPAEWCEGVQRLGTVRPPPNYPQHAWQELIVDAERFLEDWAAQAAALGWPAWELFGCHRRAPWGGVQGMGVVLLLHGRELAALTEAEAVIRTWTGARQAYRRRLHDPLHPSARCLVWELG
jgi:hypothetical protein